MKNPFEKEDNSVLIASIVIGSVAAAGVTYLLLTETGARVREELAKQVDRLRNLITGAEEPHEEHVIDYIHKRTKAPKSDREAILKHGVITPMPHAQESTDENS
jgi:hypothetical protein